MSAIPQIDLKKPPMDFYTTTKEAKAATKDMKNILGHMQTGFVPGYAGRTPENETDTARRQRGKKTPDDGAQSRTPRANRRHATHGSKTEATQRRGTMH